MAASDFPAIFADLRELMARHEPELRVLADEPSDYVLVTKTPDKKKGDVWFGAVRSGKAYVSYHLMGVYVAPGLMEGMSPELRRRMQGKSCFNFSKPLDPALTEELAALTGSCLEWYRREGML